MCLGRDYTLTEAAKSDRGAESEGGDRLAAGGLAVCSLDGAAGNVDKKCGLLSGGRAADSVQSERETNGARIDLGRIEDSDQVTEKKERIC